MRFVKAIFFSANTALLVATMSAILLMVTQGVGQNKLGQLQAELDSAQIDTIKLKKYAALTRYLRKRDLEKHVSYSNQALNYARQKDNSYYVAVFNRELGQYFDNLSRYDSSIFHFNLAKSGFEAEESTFGINAVALDIASVLVKQGKYDSAVVLYYKPIESFKKDENSGGLISCYLGIAHIHSIQKQYKKAIDVALKCPGLCNELNNRKTPCLGVVYTNLAAFYAGSLNAEEAIYYGKLALEIKEKMGAKVGLKNVHQNLFGCYFQLAKYDSAEYHSKKVLAISRSLKNNEGMVSGYHGLAQIYRRQKRLELAGKMLDSASVILEKTKNPYQMRASHQNMAIQYEDIGDYKKALFHAKQARILNDSLFTESKADAVQELETKFKTREIEQEKLLAAAEAKSNKNKFYLALFGALVIFLVSGFVVLQVIQRRRAEQVKNELSEARQKLGYERKINQAELSALKAQMNPHFLFNAFNSIQEFIIFNKKEEASEYLGSFADLMRIYLDHSQEKTITLEDEIKAAELYLQLEKVRFGDSFSYRINVDEAVDVSAVEIPPMLVQPFIENSIKHGLLHKKTDRKLNLEFTLKGRNLIAAIEDNGVGRDASSIINKQRKKSHRSFATGAINNRITLMNQSRQTPIILDTIDLKQGEVSIGTRVEITIPLI